MEKIVQYFNQEIEKSLKDEPLSNDKKLIILYEVSNSIYGLSVTVAQINQKNNKLILSDNVIKLCNNIKCLELKLMKRNALGFTPLPIGTISEFSFEDTDMGYCKK
ncbi:MAG: hypothetical protein HFI87_04125 [Bacilli bacterium]|nr:hypothetical protein [Bacilli bacterium]